MKEPFFPLHSVCLSLLRKYTEYQSSVGSSQSPVNIRKFVDACAARQEYSSKVHSAAWQSGQQAKLAPGYPWFGSVEWSHLYFGARRCWESPWNCEPGTEYLCADPIYEPRIEQFIATCLAHPQSSHQNQFSFSLSELSKDESRLICCPREVLTLIAEYLPLQSALNLHAISRRLSSRLPAIDTRFWRSRTLQLHSSWMFELHSIDGSSNANWRALLQILTTTRRQVLAGAKPYWYDKPVIENDETEDRGNEDGDTAASLPSLPLGLKNRQRIWMCLECVGMNGTQRKLNGLAEEATIEQIRTSPRFNHPLRSSKR